MIQKATAKTGQNVERWVLVAGILGSSMAFIDGTVVNVALPTLQEALDAVSRTASLLAIAVFGIAAYHRFNQALAQRLNALGVPPEIQELLANEQAGQKIAGERLWPHPRRCGQASHLRTKERSASVGSPAHSCPTTPGWGCGRKWTLRSARQ